MYQPSTPPASVPKQPKGLLGWRDPHREDDPDRVRAQIRKKLGNLSDASVRGLSVIMDALQAQDMADFLIAWWDDPKGMGMEPTPEALMRYVKGRWTIPQ